MVAAPRQAAVSIWQRVTRWAFFGLALIGLYVSAVYLVPDQRYIIHRYTAFPDTLCSGDAIDSLMVDRELREPAYVQLGAYTLDTYWQSLDGLQRTPVETFYGTFANGDDGRKSVPSPALRTTPEEPGDYRLVSITTYNWKAFGFSRVSTASYQSDRIFEVLPQGALGCR